MKRLWVYIKPYVPIMSFGLFIKFISAIMDLLIPSVLEKIIDDVVPTGEHRQIFLWGGVMVAFSVISFFCNISANRLAAKSAGSITGAIRHDLFSSIAYLSIPQTDRFTLPSLVSRLTSDTYNINQMLSRIQRMGVRAPILLVGGLLITMSIDSTLTLVLVAVLPFIVAIVYFVTKISVPIYTYCQKILDKMVMTVQENITGVRVIKALSKSEYEKKRFDKVNFELSGEERRAGIIMSLSSPSTTFILNLGISLVILVGASRVNSGLTQPGAIIAFLSYFNIILNAMLGVTKIFILCSKGIASGRRISEVLDAPADISVMQLPSIADDSHIKFDNVSFSYNKVENNLTNISFELKRGQTLGIIGPTGSGKTTIINLLLRFYDPDSGEIYIDGQNIKSIEKDRLARMFGTAFQNDFLLADTIYENISYGRALSREKILKAAHDAQADDVLKGCPEGLEHMVTARGTNLSGGQKQRLLIARALAAKPEILILDDSSGGLDYRTDAELRKALASAYSGVTSVIVAQRISSIRHAELILVMEDGHITAQGTHEELIESCELYKSISLSQMGGEIDA
ncbi:MAG: ABC transporter ATP-binding protein [Clostridiaceae bacterium]|nr:ABC transporter ATP-binding protein [Clostridiaceae bacterium]